VEWGIDSEVEEEKVISLQIYKPNSKIIYFSGESKHLIVKGTNKYNKKIILKDPRLWWPNGYGQQPLYKLKLSIEGTKSSKERLFGIRSVDLVLRKGKEKRFTFKINSKMIYAKGAN
jgi:beta-mannosidase